MKPYLYIQTGSSNAFTLSPVYRPFTRVMLIIWNNYLDLTRAYNHSSLHAPVHRQNKLPQILHTTGWYILQIIYALRADWNLRGNATAPQAPLSFLTVLIGS